MPAKTEKQARFMRMCASKEGRKKAKGKCPPVSVAREFMRVARRRAKKVKR